MIGITLYGKDNSLNKNSKIVLGCLFLFLFLFFYSLNYFGYFENEKRIRIENQNFKVKIIEKKVDYHNHGQTTLKFSNGDYMDGFFPIQKVELFKGDSLVKQKKSIYMKVFRNGKQTKVVNLLER